MVTLSPTISIVVTLSPTIIIVVTLSPTISVVDINVDVQHSIEVVQEVKNSQHNVVAVTKSTGLVLRGVVPSSVPVDGHLRLSLSQALCCSQTSSSHPAGIVVGTLEQRAIVTCV